MKGDRVWGFCCWMLVIFGLAIPPLGGILWIIFGALGWIDPEL